MEIPAPTAATATVDRLRRQLTESRRAEEAQRQSGERFRLLIEHGGEFVFRYLAGPRRFDYISPGIADLCGYAASEFVDNPGLVFDIVHADDRGLLRGYLEAGDYARPLALRCLRRDGEVVWVEQRSLPTFGADGRLEVLEGVVRNVTGYGHALEDLERRAGSVEERERMLLALRRIGSATLESLDVDHVLDTLSQQVVHAGILRSLMVAVVDHERRQVRVSRNYLSFDGRYEEGIGRVRPGARMTASPTVAHRDGERLVFSDQRIVGTTYGLDDDNITAVVARTGRFTVIDGADRRFDPRIKDRDPEARSRTVSYFIPLQRDGRVLAVLATGSDVDDRAETLRRIEAMQPLLEQAAIALDHALVHSRVREHADDLRALNERLRDEVSRRLRAEATLRGFSQRTVHLAEDERRRVARELHDGVNQLLCAVGFGLEAATREAGTRGRSDLTQTRQLLDRTIDEVRRISQDLRPGVLDDLGLGPAVRSLCDAYHRRSGVVVTHDLEQIPETLPAEVAVTLYRLLQVGLQQWSQPEASTAIHVGLRGDAAGIVASIADPGGRADAAAGEPLLHMREWAGLLGGRVEVAALAEGGARLEIHLPADGGAP